MTDWISFFVALFQTMAQWLGSLELMGVSVLWIIISFFILGVMLRVLIFKP